VTAKRPARTAPSTPADGWARLRKARSFLTGAEFAFELGQAIAG